MDSLGTITIISRRKEVEVMPGYKGPLTDTDLDHPLPPRKWSPIVGGAPIITAGPLRARSADYVQIDGRSYTVDLTWSGLRFIMKIDKLNVEVGKTVQNLFTTHIGHTINGQPHWTEVGVVRAVDHSDYRLYTYDNADNIWKFFGTANPGDVFEFAIRLNESDTGPFHYETFCNGRRVRTGSLPRLDNQVDISHESWSQTGSFSPGDFVMAVEGWVNYPPNKARWYAPDLNTGFYTTNNAIKQVRQGPPFAHKFESQT